MSGGKFNYKQVLISGAAHDVEICIHEGKYSDETISKLRECKNTLRLAAAMLQRVDRLLCCDDDESDFLTKWCEDKWKHRIAEKPQILDEITNRLQDDDGDYE